MFKKDIWYKLVILIICFALVIGLCTWKSNANNEVDYDINRYNLLNKVEWTENSEQLLDIEQNDYNKYKIYSTYNSSEKKVLNSNEKDFFLDENYILNTNINMMVEYFETAKIKGLDLTKSVDVPFLLNESYILGIRVPRIIKFSSALINNILKYKTQLERFKKLEENSFVNFNQLNDILKTDFSDLNEFLLKLEEKDANQNYNKNYINVRKNLMRFYSILFKLYGEDKMKKLVSNFTQGSFENKNEKPQVAGVTFFTSNLFNQHIKLKDSVFCSKMCKENYIKGFWSSFNCTYVLIHEMGHAIDNFFALNQKQYEKLHTTNFSFALPFFKNIALDSFYAYCSSLSIKYDPYKNTSTLQDHIEQIIIKPQNYINNSLKNNDSNGNDFKKTAMFVFAPSGYARNNEENSEIWKKEFFAECFAYWILTPDKYRDIRWAIINDYFLNKFGQ